MFSPIISESLATRVKWTASVTPVTQFHKTMFSFLKPEPLLFSALLYVISHMWITFISFTRLLTWNIRAKRRGKDTRDRSGHRVNREF